MCENVMWIILIGLLSGVIAVCSLWEHSGNDAPSVRTAKPLCLWIMGNYGNSADSGDTQTYMSPTHEKTARVSAQAHRRARVKFQRLTID